MIGNHAGGGGRACGRRRRAAGPLGRLLVKKLLALLAAVVLALGTAGIAIAADGLLPHTGRVVFVAGGDVELALWHGLGLPLAPD